MLDAVEQLSQDQFTLELGGSFGSVRNTVVHTLSAECVWLARWKGENPPGMLAPDAYPDLASVRRAWTDNETRLRQLFEPLDEAGLQKVIPYKTFAGVESPSARSCRPFGTTLNATHRSRRKCSLATR